MIYLRRGSIRRVEIWAWLGDERASAGWADAQTGCCGNLGMAILANRIHIEKITPDRKTTSGWVQFGAIPGDWGPH